jgi:uncharacterized protein (TIGR03066 family)
MSALRLVLAGLLLVGLTALAGAQETDKAGAKKDTKKTEEGKVSKRNLMGTWEIKGKAPEGAPTVVTFSKGNKVTFSGLKEGKKGATRGAGTFTLEGNKLTVTVKGKGKKDKGKAGQMTDTMTITKLTKDTLVLTHTQGGKERTVEYRKRKPRSE